MRGFSQVSVQQKDIDAVLLSSNRFLRNMRVVFILSMAALIALFMALYKQNQQDSIKTLHKLSISETARNLSDLLAKKALELRAFDQKYIVPNPLKNIAQTPKPNRLSDMKSELSTILMENVSIHQYISQLGADWRNVTPEFRELVAHHTSFENPQVPYLEIAQLASVNKLQKVATVNEIFQEVRSYLAAYDAELQPKLKQFNNFMGDYAIDLITGQTNMQKRYMIYAAICILFIVTFLYFVCEYVHRRQVHRLVKQSQLTMQALDHARKADNAKTEFLATMSHEIRTPMNGITGMTNLLRETKLNERQSTFVDVIEKSTGLLLAVISDVLDFAKIQASQLTLNREEFNLQEIVEEMGFGMMEVADNKDIELSINIDQTIPDAIFGDSERLGNILSKLISNAVKFTERGHVMVKVSNISDVCDQSNGEVRLNFEIADTGCGIAQDRLDTIFEKFIEVDGSITRAHDGVGLGLAIASRLVELMGGDLRVASRLGEGSCFRFMICLPIAPNRLDEVGVSDSAQTQMMANAQTTEPAKPARILIVDGNRLTQGVMADYCRAWGHDAVVVDSGCLAKNFVNHSTEGAHCPIDLLIVNYELPDMKCAEFIRDFREDTQQAKVPILVANKLSGIDQMKGLSRLNLQGCITLPIKASAFKTQISTVLENAMNGEWADVADHDIPPLCDEDSLSHLRANYYDMDEQDDAEFVRSDARCY